MRRKLETRAAKMEAVSRMLMEGGASVCVAALARKILKALDAWEDRER